MRNYTIFFPTYNSVSELIISFNEGAKVSEGLPYRNIKPIVYYGSSITQGASASRSDLNYQALYSKSTNIDYLNFGFSGNAKGELCVAREISKYDMSIFVMALDYSCGSAQELDSAHYNFYKEMRKNKPDLPIVLISNVDH